MGQQTISLDKSTQVVQTVVSYICITNLNCCITNLKTHLHTWHRPIHDELYKDSIEVETTSSSTLDNFVSKRITPLSQSSEKAKKLTHAICEMIARDVHPISIVNDVGFLNL